MDKAVEKPKVLYAFETRNTSINKKVKDINMPRQKILPIDFWGLTFNFKFSSFL